MQEIYALPATELAGWQEYYNIYPFPQEREDVRNAMLLDALNKSVQWLYSKEAKDFTYFLPDYLGERDLNKQSEARQIEAEKAFVDKLLASGLGTVETKQ